MTPDQMARRIAKLDRTQTPGQTFSDLIDLSFHSLAKAAWMAFGQSPDQERCAHHERAYMEVVERYRRRDRLDLIREAGPEFLGTVLNEVAKGGVDYLGQTAAELETLNKFLGQFFTPYELCRLLANFTLADAETIIAEKGFISVQEPASGAGAMILAGADMLQSLGLKVSTSMFVEVRDLSDLCFKMCFIQLTARGVAARCVRGNTLHGDPQQYEIEVIPTVHMLEFLARHGDPFADQRTTLPEEAQAAPGPEAFTHQLSFAFGDEEAA